MTNEHGPCSLCGHIGPLKELSTPEAPGPHLVCASALECVGRLYPSPKDPASPAATGDAPAPSGQDAQHG